jgi:hypothetical protein
MKHITLKNIFQLLIGILLLGILLFTIRPGDILSALITINPFYVILAFLLYSFTFYILTKRWQMIVAHMGVFLPTAVAYTAFAGGFFISDLTPARVGDLSRALLVRDYLEPKKGTVSVLIDRYIDIVTIFVLGTLGIVFLSAKMLNMYAIGIVILFLGIIISIAVLVHHRSGLNDIIRRINCESLSVFYGTIDETLNEYHGDWQLYIKAFFLTICAWITHAFRLILLGLAFNYSLPFLPLMLLQPLISALSLIPITIAGLGLVEGGLTALLLQLGVPVTIGLTLALVDRAITTFFHFIVGMRSLTKII